MAGFVVPVDVIIKNVVFWAVTLYTYLLKEVRATWPYFPESLLFVVIKGADEISKPANKVVEVKIIMTWIKKFHL
jgi:hypothetical protein